VARRAARNRGNVSEDRVASVAAAKEPVRSSPFAFVWPACGLVQEGIVKKCTTVCSLDYLLRVPNRNSCLQIKRLRILVRRVSVAFFSDLRLNGVGHSLGQSMHTPKPPFHFPGSHLRWPRAHSLLCLHYDSIASHAASRKLEMHRYVDNTLISAFSLRRKGYFASERELAHLYR
jgi:hypothetical protein